MPTTRYNAGFALPGRTGTYTYQWHIDGLYLSVYTGCTPTSPPAPCGFAAE